jgi:hypothetical protein
MGSQRSKIPSPPQSAHAIGGVEEGAKTRGKRDLRLRRLFILGGVQVAQKEPCLFQFVCCILQVLPISSATVTFSAFASRWPSEEYRA